MVHWWHTQSRLASISRDEHASAYNSHAQVSQIEITAQLNKIHKIYHAILNEYMLYSLNDFFPVS